MDLGLSGKKVLITAASRGIGLATAKTFADAGCDLAIGALANVFAQDTFNLPNVQRGLRAASHEHVILAKYQETKLRHFHTLLEKYLNA
jgi:NAD(P)-dependent dehydrogenase (short-subunit alcohol dehydrogenase family)